MGMELKPPAEIDGQTNLVPGKPLVLPELLLMLGHKPRPTKPCTLSNKKLLTSPFLSRSPTCNTRESF